MNSTKLSTTPKIVYEKAEDLETATKERVEKMNKEFSKQPTIKLFENTEGYDQIIAQVGIPFTANCEHHGVAFSGVAHIAYIPDKWLTGLSKIARVVEYYLNPTIESIQERATHQIMKHFSEALKPEGLMVILKARHNCVCYRGVKKPSVTITSAVQGSFKKSGKAKQEFLSLISDDL